MPRAARRRHKICRAGGCRWGVCCRFCLRLMQDAMPASLRHHAAAAALFDFSPLLATLRPSRAPPAMRACSQDGAPGHRHRHCAMTARAGHAGSPGFRRASRPRSRSARVRAGDGAPLFSGYYICFQRSMPSMRDGRCAESGGRVPLILKVTRYRHDWHERYRHHASKRRFDMGGWHTYMPLEVFIIRGDARATSA